MRCLSFVTLVILATAAAEDLAVLPNDLEGAAPRAMVHQYLLDLSDKALERRVVEYEKLKTPEDVARYQRRLREFFVAKLGGFPERTPLNARVVGRHERDGYRIEKVIFESQPGMFVTAILYLPEAKGLRVGQSPSAVRDDAAQPGAAVPRHGTASTPPYPAVLVPCGHSVNGKARDLYQRAPMLIAKNGMAAMCYDPIDQGERIQLLDADGKPRATSTKGHTMLAVGSMLVGRNTATFRTWDGMRAIDYLQSREEIDPKRIGCTGISGGGTLTSYLMALDERVEAAAPGCYLTNFRRLTHTLGPQDGEQCIHAQIAFGMDHADYVILRAPKPTLIMTATRDYFDIGGAWATFREAKRVYGRLGYAERVDLVEADTEHGFPPEMRIAATRWMRRWLLGVDDAVGEVESPVAADEELWCTPRGQVMFLDGARTAYDINLDLEKKLAPARKKFWQETPVAEALAEIRRVTGIRKLADLPELKWEKTATLPRDGYRIDKLILRPEPGIWLPALAFVPTEHDGNAYLYLNAEGKHADAAPGGAIEKLVRAGHVVLAVDLRGLGETFTDAKPSYGPYIGPGWQDMFLAYMVDRSYLAMRVEDTMVSARFLAGFESGGKPNRVHLVSIGPTGPAALHAAALEPGLFASVVLRKSLRSWSDVVHNPLAVHQLINAVHGALLVYDLPDLAATLPAGSITIEEPLDSEGSPVATSAN